MKLEVGMYVRTKYGIAKIIKTDFINEYLDKPFLVVDRELEIGLIGGNDESLCDKKDIIGKPSYEVTDLIEVGDIIAIKENIDKYAQVFILGIYEPQLLNEIKSKIDRNELILDSVLTKEQFESMKYEVYE